MSTLNETAATAAPISHNDNAQALIEQVRAMRERIPNFVVPKSKDERQRLSQAASVPPEFVELTAVAVTNSQALVRGEGADPAQARDQMSYGEAYLPLADELEALGHFIRHSVTAAKNRAGSDALTTYALAKRLAKRPETADLAPHVADMRRALGRSRKAKSKTTPPVTPTPTAPVTPATPSTSKSS